MTGSEQIIVVDDDRSVREAICDYLARYGFAMRAVSGAAELDRALEDVPADLVILDLMIPGEDGLSICRRLGRSGGPAVLMLSALGNVTDRIVGLEIGADDYLGKPFEPRELLARVRAVLRRSQPALPDGGPLLLFEGWRYDRETRSLIDPEGEAVPLTRGEHVLLSVFAERPGRILSRDYLLDATRGPEAESFDRAVDLSVSRLRRKLGGAMIETVRGEGYRFRPKVRRG